jgi:hypothetical protein
MNPIWFETLVLPFFAVLRTRFNGKFLWET